MNQILHLGLGRFHRGHQAVYYQKSGNWRVISSTMRSADERDKLRKVHLRYPVLELSYETENLTWIECLDEVLSLHDDLDRLLEVFLSPETKIITLTVTEKGYCLNSSGELDLNHPGIQNDMKHPLQPQTAIGLLALGLKNRKEKLTIISCDNLRENGKKLELAVKKFMASRNEELPGNLFSFPNTMVDRIVPALLPEKMAELERQHSLKNSELIATETFSQWVIEDKFMGTRPDWDKVGVQFVQDVKPFEEMKLKLLNASHSYLAYAGLNRGHQYVHEAIADEELFSVIMAMLKNEVIPLLVVPEGYDVNAYVNQLMKRFRNNKLPHQLKQIAMDGSQKMPQRIFSSITEAKKKQLSSKLLMSAVDEWLDFIWKSRDEKIDDPKASDLLSGSTSGKENWKAQKLKEFGI